MLRNMMESLDFFEVLFKQGVGNNSFTTTLEKSVYARLVQ